ncbi:Serine/threonine protein kinase [Handroanthus impetiginosus]|uniref:Serine/threonine protein kinase n=1 Tax=Handroanthus impetiginosus TaxID=429701 RepID=A0A2G9GTC0_9LAMI|nr:Serine/threonine protein kinase [Handroanthus impetiginosus]
MLSPDLLLKCFYYLFMIMICSPQTSHGKQSPYCSPSACGHISNISYPFRLRDDPQHCGNSRYELSCENNTTTILYFGPQKYHVQAINYDNYTIRLTDPAVKDDTCSFPQQSLAPYNFSCGDPYRIKSPIIEFPYEITRSITFMSCPSRVSNPLLLETTQCFDRHSGFDIENRSYTYLKFGHLNAAYVMDMCRIDLMVMTSLPIKDEKSTFSLSEIHSSLLYGFELSWLEVLCVDKRGCSDSGFIACELCQKRPLCRKKDLSPDILYRIIIVLQFSTVFGVALNLALRILIGMPCILLALLVYKLRRRHVSVFDVIEGFLQSNNNLIPIRYSYSDIKKMTRGFREKLGQGSYGSVYKGKLRSGHDVAVKVLSKSRANGQDFINEVATIGRIHHVNVVKLVGYCAERSKRALVYDFMTNGSLEKYIFNRERANSLNWESKYEIAIGVARGIEYLHKGCDVQILHFDIKPHNILLDDKFTPKISDFGLAKFYSTENTTVTLTAARGTIGYVAPELINRSIGRVSYKADVYSFGMLLMEMLSLKKDMVEANDDESSKYFPYWIYDCFNRGKDIETGNVDEDDDDDELSRKITRNMTIIGLWCIQMSPNDRPSMSEVIKMFESDCENLQIPPLQPFQSPQTTQGNAETWGTESTDSVALLGDDVSSDA